MRSKKCRSKISTRNRSNTEEIREKDRERKKRKRAILRGEKVENQPIIGELNVISNSIGIVYFYAIQFHIHIYNFVFLVI